MTWMFELREHKVSERYWGFGNGLAMARPRSHRRTMGGSWPRHVGHYPAMTPWPSRSRSVMARPWPWPCHACSIATELLHR